MPCVYLSDQGFLYATVGSSEQWAFENKYSQSCPFSRDPRLNIAVATEWHAVLGLLLATENGFVDEEPIL